MQSSLPKMKLALLFTLLALGAAVAAGKSDEQKAFNEHKNRVDSFRCKDPQKRIIPVSSLKALPSDEHYLPEATVLHRCDLAAGLCLGAGSYGCGPAETEEVSLVFQVRKALPKRRRDMIMSLRYETITAVNHTMCECQLLSNMPK